jgi:hypothetical protein
VTEKALQEPTEATEDLAVAIERAAGPCRELDHAIAAAVGWPDSPYHHANARRYTESLDAAVTLVPEWAGWMVMGNAAKVGRWPSRGASPALALCAAAMLARGAGPNG